MKITKRQLRRIIKEEKAKLMSKAHPRATADNAVAGLMFSLDEYGMARAAAGVTDAETIRQEIMAELEAWLSDATIDGTLDTSRW